MGLSGLARSVRERLAELFPADGSGGNSLRVAEICRGRGISHRKRLEVRFEVRREAGSGIGFEEWAETLLGGFSEIAADGQFLRVSKASSCEREGAFYFTFEVKADCVEYEPEETMRELAAGLTVK